MYLTFLDITDKYIFLLVKRNNFQPMFKGSLTYELAYQEIEILKIIDSFLIHYSFLSNHLHKHCVGAHLLTKIACH